MRKLLGVVMLALVGCATPYQPKGLLGGYDDFPAGRGTIMVTFDGNGYTSEGDVLKMWHRRAAEICGGVDRYVVVDSKGSSQTYQGASTSTTNVTYSGNQAYATTTTQPGMTWTKHSLQGLVHCVSSEPVARQSPPAPTQAAPSSPTPPAIPLVE